MTPQLAFALGFLVAVAVTALVTLALARLMRDIVTPPTANPTTRSGKVTLDDVALTNARGTNMLGDVAVDLTEWRGGVVVGDFDVGSEGGLREFFSG